MTKDLIIEWNEAIVDGGSVVISVVGYDGENEYLLCDVDEMRNLTNNEPFNWEIQAEVDKSIEKLQTDLRVD